MLRRLQIEDYALIDRVVIEFAAGFNVLSGETGSGKSIVVDALGLLLGERADTSAIRSGMPQAVVIGSFDPPFATAAAHEAWCAAHGLNAPEAGAEITLRRELTTAGRGRAYIDNQPVTLAVLRELAQRLGTIHAQAEALVTFSPVEQLALLDRFAGTAPAAVAAAYHRWREAVEQWRHWQEQERARAAEAELWRFQLREIQAAAPRVGEDDGLEQERARLTHAERIGAAAQALYERLYDAPEAVATQLKAAGRHLNEWLRFDPSVAPLAPRLEALQLEARDIAEQVRDLSEGIAASPERLREVQERLDTLDGLKRKFGPSLADVVAHGEELAARLDQVDNAATHARRLADAATQTGAAYREAAGALSRLRHEAATRLAPLLRTEARELGLQIRFEIAWEEPADESAWTAGGWDRLRFLMSANPGEPPQPLESVASGGERSRLLLALHVIAARSGAGARRGTPAAARLMVFDEIDAGIGGRAAEAVGAKLRQLGESSQVLCVTHLAQIATFAACHHRVEKHAAQGRTRTEVTRLTGNARVEEIARMLAGNEHHPTALRHAKELLAAHAG